MSQGAGQTPLSEFLRFGAAGASGTVTEPYSPSPTKFPSPMIQVHYARGCTLAEAFYQSVSGPYQLLDRRRSALPALGRDSAGLGDGRQGGGRGPRQPDALPLGHARPATPRPTAWNCSSTASAGRLASRAKACRWTPRLWPTAITNCGWWPSGRRRSNRKGGRSFPFK